MDRLEFIARFYQSRYALIVVICPSLLSVKFKPPVSCPKFPVKSTCALAF
jgi:hypothetical protein